MNDYARIAAVIRHLDEVYGEQPSLEHLAQVAGLSPAHFHRLFHRWAGITPKAFLQCLTAEHAKQCLRESASVLDAALESGLSGPGRLHDLLVTLEAASPGEIKSAGAGLTIGWGTAASPFGGCSVAWNARGLCHLAFRDSEKDPNVPEELRRDWPEAKLHRDNHEASRQIKCVFNSETSASVRLRAFVRGTPFQLQVWRALLRIPEGRIASYGRLAQLIGDPKAARAVGTACGANPIAYLIPCHRVIRETGAVRGYRWGTERKRIILAWEEAKIRRAASS